VAKKQSTYQLMNEKTDKSGVPCHFLTNSFQIEGFHEPKALPNFFQD